MNFDFSEDQKLLQQTARDFLSKTSSLEVTRRVLETSASYDADLWKGTAEMGWQGVVIPEEYGGAGFGHLELAVIAEELGRALAPIPFFSSVYLATEALLLAGSGAQKARYLPRLASGELIGTLAIFERPGHSGLDRLETRFERGRLSGVKRPVADGEVAGLAVVTARTDAGVSLVLADLGAGGATRRGLESLDPSRPQAQIDFAGAPAELLGGDGEGARVAERVLDRAAVLLAFEQIGGAERSFDLTREYTMGRYAFGRPVASFQALKHRMADLFCAIELARSNAYFGAWALSHDAPELPLAACQSRIAATEAFERSAVESIQMHGGVGYTWEYDCHLFYRRSKRLAGALGDARAWKEKLIRRIEAGGRS